MSKPVREDHPEVLDEDTLWTLGCAQRATELPPGRMKALYSRLMERIDSEEEAEQAGFVTIRSFDGPWIQIAPKIKKKVLRADPAQGTETYLLRVDPGAEAPPHEHEHDEICLMLEGEVTFGAIHLRAGDYHLAPKGSRHETARSDTGALVLIQTSFDGNQVAL
ncbi:MAG: cupin domain-containing protein [Pseudomonadota bacterium]|nr:cupin domain-containing protein [Pseudomonadota bacterium]